MTYHDYLRFTRGNSYDTEKLIRLIKTNLAGLVMELASDSTLDAIETLRAAAKNQPHNMENALDKLAAFVMDDIDIMGEPEPMEKIGFAMARVILNNNKLFESISGLEEGGNVDTEGD